MGLSAIGSVGDAVELTREFMTPAAAGRWARLMALALAVGAGGASLSANVPPASPTLDPTYSGPTPRDVSAGDVEIPFEGVTEGQLLAAAAVVLAALVAVALLFGLVQAIAEFAFVEALRSGDVSLRRSVRRHLRRGIGLFAFRLALGAAALAAVGGAAGLALATGAAEEPAAAVPVVAPVAAAAAVLAAVVDRFTSLLVVPVAIRRDCGVLAGWRRLRAAIAGARAEFLAFAVIQYALGAILAGATAAALAAVAAVLAAVVVLVAGALSLAGVPVLAGPGLAVLAVLVAPALFGLLLAAAAVQVPVQAYLRYYGLLVLGDVDPALDLVAERRRRVRERRLGGVGERDATDR